MVDSVAATNGVLVVAGFGTKGFLLVDDRVGGRFGFFGDGEGGFVANNGSDQFFRADSSTNPVLPILLAEYSA